ncbi:unnamed protein product [Ectocarpus sp. 12 AP-2014]
MTERHPGRHSGRLAAIRKRLRRRVRQPAGGPGQGLSQQILQGVPTSRGPVGGPAASHRGGFDRDGDAGWSPKTPPGGGPRRRHPGTNTGGRYSNATAAALPRRGSRCSARSVAVIAAAAAASGAAAGAGAKGRRPFPAAIVPGGGEDCDVFAAQEGGKLGGG